MKSISVIIPVYNTIHFLERCISSVLAQTFVDFELILVDDGSTDGSGSLCDTLGKAYPQMIQVLHQKNSGVGAARNAGMKVAKGRYLYFLDSDDWIAPETLILLYHSTQQNQAQMAIGGMSLVFPEGRIESLSEMVPSNIALHPETNRELLLVFAGIVNKLIDRCLLEQLGFTFSELKIGEDLQFYLKLIAFTDTAVYINRPLYSYFDNKTSAMNSLFSKGCNDILRAFHDTVMFYRSHNLFAKYYDELEYLAVEHLLFSAAIRFIKEQPKNPDPYKLVDFLKVNFPQYYKNKYLTGIGKRRKLILYLLSKKQIKLIRLLFKAKSVIKLQS